jgi:hypothetical protein
MRRIKQYAVGAGGMLVLVAAVVLATGSGSAVAAQIGSVFVTNDSSHPVPVKTQAVVPVTDGGEVFTGRGCQDEQHLDSPVTATAISIHMSSGVTFVNLQMNGASANPTSPLIVAGPAEGGSADFTLALTRPIEFDTINCVHDSTTDNTLSVSWVGNNP